MGLSSIELQAFVSLTVILGAGMVALIVDYLKEHNEQLRERNIELSVLREEEGRRSITEIRLLRERMAAAALPGPGGQTGANEPVRVVAVRPLQETQPLESDPAVAEYLGTTIEAHTCEDSFPADLTLKLEAETPAEASEPAPVVMVTPLEEPRVPESEPAIAEYLDTTIEAHTCEDSLPADMTLMPEAGTPAEARDPAPVVMARPPGEPRVPEPKPAVAEYLDTEDEPQVLGVALPGKITPAEGPVMPGEATVPSPAVGPTPLDQLPAPELAPAFAGYLSSELALQPCGVTLPAEILPEPAPADAGPRMAACSKIRLPRDSTFRESMVERWHPEAFSRSSAVTANLELDITPRSGEAVFPGEISSGSRTAQAEPLLAGSSEVRLLRDRRIIDPATAGDGRLAFAELLADRSLRLEVVSSRCGADLRGEITPLANASTPSVKLVTPLAEDRAPKPEPAVGSYVETANEPQTRDVSLPTEIAPVRAPAEIKPRMAACSGLALQWEPVRKHGLELTKPATGLPRGYFQPGEIDTLVVSNRLVTGVVVAIGIKDYKRVAPSQPKAGAPDLMDSVDRLVRSMISPAGFAFRRSEDEFIITFANERGAAATERISRVAERLWDFQLRSLAAFSALFTWGAVAVVDQRFSDAVELAADEMSESRAGRRRPRRNNLRTECHAVSA